MYYGKRAAAYWQEVRHLQMLLRRQLTAKTYPSLTLQDQLAMPMIKMTYPVCF